MNPLAVAVQGLGFAAAVLALQGLLYFVAEEVIRHESLSGGGLKTRRRVTTRPFIDWPVSPVEEDDALMLAGIL